MTALRHTLTLASFELRGIVRGRWLVGGAVVFSLVTLAVTLAGLRSFASLGLAGAGAAVDGLLEVTLLLPPLLALLLGASGLARDRERGMLAMLAVQPVPRALSAPAAFVGAVLAVWAGTAAGLGVGLLVLSGSATSADLVALVQVVAIGLAASASCVALGVLIASVAGSHQQATAAAAALWLLLALGMDLLLAGVAPGLRLGPTGLLAALVVNPLEAARVLALLVTGGVPALGPFGSYLIDVFGRSGSVRFLGAVVAGWTLLPLGIAAVVMARRDV